MRLTKMLGISFPILILATFAIPSCQATIEKDFGEFHEISFDDILFSFNVKVAIETEKDGTWRNNTIYQIHVIISLTCVNRSKIEIGHFLLEINETSFTQSVEIGSYTLSATLSWTNRKAEMRYTVKSPNYYPTFSLSLEPQFKYNFRHPYMGDLSRTWSPEEPIYIYMTSTDTTNEVISKIDSIENQLNTIRNLMYVLILTTIILLALTGYYAVRKTKKN